MIFISSVHSVSAKPSGKMGIIILDFETIEFDDLRMYFALDHLASQLEKQRKEEELPDSLDEVSLCHYDDSLDMKLASCSVDSLEENCGTDHSVDSLDEDAVNDSLDSDHSDTESYSLEKTENIVYTEERNIAKEDEMKNPKGSISNITLRKSELETDVSHIGCQHVIVKDCQSHGQCARLDCSNVLDFLMFFGEK